LKKHRIRIGREILGCYDFLATYPGSTRAKSPVAVGFLAPLLLVPLLLCGSGIPLRCGAKSSSEVDFLTPLLLVPLLPGGGDILGIFY